MNGVNWSNWISQLSSWLEFLVGGDYPVTPLQLHQIVLRAILVYLAGLAIVRTGKSRLLGRISPLDALIGFVLGSIMGRGITGSASLSGTIVGCGTIVAVHWLLSWLSCHSHWLGD